MQQKSTSSATSTYPEVEGRFGLKTYLGEKYVSLIAGGIGGMVGGIVTCPIEVIKVRRQSLAFGHSLKNMSSYQICKNLIRNEGALSLLKGLTPTLVGAVPSRAISFFVYENSKRKAQSSGIGNDNYLTHMTAASVSAFVTTTVTSPIWVIKTRFQLMQDDVSNIKDKNIRKQNSWRQVTRKIYQESGFRGFWKGLSASYLGVNETVIQFLLYENIKKRLRNNDLHQVMGLGYATESLFSILFSKTVACLIMYPHEVVRTRMREYEGVLSASKVEASNKKVKIQGDYSTLIKSFSGIYRYEGVKGLYRGLWTHLLRAVPNTSIIFLTYETFKRL